MLIAIVLPRISEPMSLGLMPESASVSKTPASGWRGVEGRLVTISRPETSDCSFCTTPIRSVKVPPVSMPYS